MRRFSFYHPRPYDFFLNSVRHLGIEISLQKGRDRERGIPFFNSRLSSRGKRALI